MNAIYEGEVFHSRVGSVNHSFKYPIYFYRVDVDQLEALSKGVWLFSHNAWNIVSIYDRDYLDRSNLPLRKKVENWLEKSGTPLKPKRIELVSSARFFGYVFNPVSFFYCYDEEDSLTAILAEVSNTFGERHLYVASNLTPSEKGEFDPTFEKLFHVSPFYARDGEYRFRFTRPDKDYFMRIDLYRDNKLALRGQMNAKSLEFSGPRMLRTLVRYPLTAALTMPRILWQAAKLHFGKRLPVYTKPNPKSEWTHRVKPANFLQRLCQKAVLKFLRSLKSDGLVLKMPEGEELTFGSPHCSDPAILNVHSYEFFKRTALAGDIGLGEAFTSAEWTSPNPVRVLQFFIRNWENKTDSELPWAALGRKLNRWRHLSRANTLTNSPKNIMDHYDLSNDFFALFLDPSMTYSSGIYSSSLTSLEDAQRAKIDRIISLAQIGPNDHVLEIGCGWGGFAIRAAKTTGCRVTGITLSPSQLEEAQRRVRAAGLEKQIELKLIDYRKMSGEFDKIVSIEMLEAVGHENFDSYFSSIDRLLKKDGIAALQGITMPDHRYAAYLQGTDWIQKHVFPGGEIASVSGLSASMARSSKLSIEKLDSFPLDYAQTLRDWRKTFHERIDEVRKLGFGDDFIRTWDYYFCYCEAGFNERVISVIQLQLSRPHNNKLKRD